MKKDKDISRDTNQSNDKALPRRRFLGVAAAGVASAAMLSVAGCETPTSSESGEGAVSGGNPSESATVSGTYAWNQPFVPITEFVDEQTYDVVVIGAGIAGCGTAQSAAEGGAKVAVIEKSDDITAHGLDIGAVGSKLQKEKGYVYDKAEAARLIYEWSQSQADWYLIKTFIERSAEVMDHYIDMAESRGLRVVLNDTWTARSDWYELEKRFRQLKFTAHNFYSDTEYDMPSYNLINMLRESAIENAATFLFNTKAEQLIKEGNTVTGVVVSDAEGYKRINATKGVVLATGGIGGNPDMIHEWCPLCEKADPGSPYMPVGGNAGDGIVMTMQIGGARSRCYPAPLVHPINFGPLGPGFDTSWLFVNRDGMRFCTEVAYEPSVTNARMNSFGNITWAIFDAHYKENYERMEPTKSKASLEGIDEKVAQAVTDGSFVLGNTLDELAAAIEVPADAFKATVDKYNRICEAGEDPDFGVPARFLSPVVDPPFYACKVAALLLALPYGVHVNQESQVLTDDDEVIENLYAAGNVQGDFFANSYPVAVPGTSHGRALTFGRLIGLKLATGEPIDAYKRFGQ